MICPKSLVKTGFSPIPELVFFLQHHTTFHDSRSPKALGQTRSLIPRIGRDNEATKGKTHFAILQFGDPEVLWGFWLSIIFSYSPSCESQFP